MSSYKEYINRIPWKIMSYIVISLGVVVRLKVLIENRSIFIDEANLARNVAERGYLDFFTNLSYEQYAPPLFLVETKLLTDLLGNYEWVHRLIPFIAGVGAIWFLWLLIEEWLEHPLSKLYAIGLFCFSVLAIRYGSEFKQYSGDTFLALAFIRMAWRDRDIGWGPRVMVIWALLGAICIWYSMPLVFVLSGVGLFFLHASRLGDWKYILGAIFFWLVSFAAYYFLILRNDIGSDYLEDFFEKDFITLTSLEGSHWLNNIDLLVRLFRNVTDKTAISIGFGMVLFIWGAIKLLRTDLSKALLLLLPPAVLLLASALHFYPIMDRMILVIMPLIILVLGKGLDNLLRIVPNWAAVLLSLLVLLSLINKKGYEKLWQPMTFEELRPCLEELKSKVEEDDLIFLHHAAVPAYEYYTKHYQESFFLSNETTTGKWDTDLSAELSKLTGRRLWLIFSHLEDDKIASEIVDIPNMETSECTSERAALFLITPQ